MTVRGGSRKADRAWLRLTALAGIPWAVLEFTGFLLGAAGTQPFASHEVIRRSFVDAAPPARVWVGQYLVTVAAFAFLLFAARLWLTLKSAEGTPGWISAVALAGGVLASAFWLGGLASFNAIYTRAGTGLVPSEAATLSDFGFALFIRALPAALSVFLAASAIVSLRSAALPRWLGWTAGVVALLLQIPVATPGNRVLFVAEALVVAWVVAAGIVLFRRSDELGV